LDQLTVLEAEVDVQERAAGRFGGDQGASALLDHRFCTLGIAIAGSLRRLNA
jgi:hypothetical protein